MVANEEGKDQFPNSLTSGQTPTPIKTDNQEETKLDELKDEENAEFDDYEEGVEAPPFQLISGRDVL